MRLFDSHSHIDDPCYDADLAQVLLRARAADVQGIMIAGINVGTSAKAITIAGSHPGIITSVGVHPHDATDCSDLAIEALKDLAQNPCVKAWGEIGLDFNRMYSPAAVQEQWLEAQLHAACDLGLPVIFHERDSGGRFLEMVQPCKRLPLRGVVHCFSGTREEMFSYLDLGFYIGITGILTIQKRGELLRELAALIPEDRLLIETDAPYLTPAPEKNRSRRNEPAFVRSVFLKLAEIRKADPEALAETLWDNTCRLFGL
ncbi:MAG: TatD family hydrolase [Pseudomonadota bacterium]